MFALSGFSFQFMVSLNALIDQIQTGKHEAIRFETLSDISGWSGEFYIVSQVKLTLSSRAVRSAIKELWTIYSLVREKFPGLGPDLNYQLIAKNSQLVKLSKAVENWLPTSAYSEISLSDFKNRLSIIVDPDPEMRLATRLVNNYSVEAPFETISKWIGWLWTDVSPQGLDRSCQRIINDIKGLEISVRERNRNFYLWSNDDRPPSTVKLEKDPNKAILTGQIPKIQDLRSGRFAPRSVYRSIHTFVENWLIDRDLDEREMFSAVWITGPSGAGKSVALLNLLADVHEVDDKRVIIWLKSNAKEIERAIQWARPFFVAGKQVIFAADDPFTVGRQEDVVQAFDYAEQEFEKIVIAYPDVIRPVFMFCSPSEQFEVFDDRLDNLVCNTHFHLPNVCSEDIEELRSWFNKRTGKNISPIDTAQNVMIVLLLFEWSTGGSIKQFSNRLKTRLIGMSPELFLLVSEILALNRIYALFPALAVKLRLDENPSLGAAFDRLSEDEGQFTYVAESEGYRLTHPRIANSIYQVWFGDAHDWRFRKNHLQTGIESALLHGQSISLKMSPLWAISRLEALTNQEGGAQIDLKQKLESVARPLSELLPTIYQREFVKSDAPLSKLPVWVNLNKQLNLNLSPAPSQLLIRAIEESITNDTGLRLSCHILLQHSETISSAKETVLAVLMRSHDWHEWHRVAIHFLKKYPLTEIFDSLLLFVKQHLLESRSILNHCVSFDHLRNDQNTPILLQEWFETWENELVNQVALISDALDYWPTNHTFTRKGYKFLNKHMGHSSWSHIWERLYKNLPEDASKLVPIGFAWLKVSPKSISGWCNIWEVFWDNSLVKRSKLYELGIEWLRHDLSHLSWTFNADRLWKSYENADRLWKSHEAVTKLVDVTKTWIKENHTHGSWAFFWEKLWKNPNVSNQELASEAQVWLPNNIQNGSWSFVWENVWDAPQFNKDNLAAAARIWLYERKTDPSWTFVWEKLWQESQVYRESIQPVTKDWLEQETSHNGWHRVWKKVWTDLSNLSISKSTLIRLAKLWLREIPFSHKHWANIWITLLNGFDSKEIDSELIILAFGWLKHPNSNTSWATVWLALWKYPSYRKELSSLTIKFDLLSDNEFNKIYSFLSDWDATSDLQ